MSSVKNKNKKSKTPCINVFFCHKPEQVFLVNPPIRVNDGDKVLLSFKMSRAKQYHRLMDIELISELELFSGKQFPPVTTRVSIE